MSLILTYYGDDFTGSTDSLEALTRAGIPAALFLAPPSPALLAARFPELRAVGVAGVSRSMDPAWMEVHLRSIFRQLRELGAPLCHYKTCSTFDSSSTVGSIGRAIDIGHEVFGGDFVPLVVGAPILRRYVLFGNLFATVGSETYRLDRHPTMSRHPITPMHEADLRRHLAEQTTRTVGLVDLLTLDRGDVSVDQRLQQLLQAGTDVVLYDTLGDDHLPVIGRSIWQAAQQRPLFAAGSSGFEYALAAHLRRIGAVPAHLSLTGRGRIDPIVVVSGSASPVTAAQIDWAEGHGFASYRLIGPDLVHPRRDQAAVAEAVNGALGYLARGQSVVLYTARGPEDPALAATRRAAAKVGLSAAAAGRRLAERQGQILRRVLEESGVKRVCVAGGDTASHAVGHLDILALQMIAPTAPGSPLCRITSDNPDLDGIQIALKGGQVGREDYFGVIQAGGEIP